MSRTRAWPAGRGRLRDGRVETEALKDFAEKAHGKSFPFDVSGLSRRIDLHVRSMYLCILD